MRHNNGTQSQIIEVPFLLVLRKGEVRASKKI